MDAWELRHLIYDHFATTGEAPPIATMAAWVGDPTRSAALLAELHGRHAVVLDDEGGIRMALPFSGVETPYVVSFGDRRWFANCAWDALALPRLLDLDATIAASWFDGGGPVSLAVVDGELSHAEGFVHFAHPARQWWDDIVDT